MRALLLLFIITNTIFFRVYAAPAMTAEQLTAYFSSLVKYEARLEERLSSRSSSPGEAAVENDIRRTIADMGDVGEFKSNLSKELWSLYFPNYTNQNRGIFVPNLLDQESKFRLMENVPFFGITYFEEWLGNYSSRPFLLLKEKRKAFINRLRLDRKPSNGPGFQFSII